VTTIAFLGLGEASRAIHLPACLSIRDLEVVAGADPCEESRSQFRRKAPHLTLHASAGELLDAVQPDWVLVAAPPSHHAALCIQALEAGAHVFCEKPFVEVSSDARAILEASEKAKRVVAVNLEFPSMPIHAALIEAARTRTHGPPLFLSAWQTMRMPPEEEQTWRGDGKTMQEFGTHVVSLAYEIFGDWPQTVAARMPKTALGQGDLVDIVTLEFPCGGVANLVLNRVCAGRHRYLDLRLDTPERSLRSSIGGRASASVSLAPGTKVPQLKVDLARGGMAWMEKSNGRQVLARNPDQIFVHSTGLHLAQVIETVGRGERPRWEAREALQVVRVVEAAYRAANEGRVIQFDE
jgi:predicted dehydrogenase